MVETMNKIEKCIEAIRELKEACSLIDNKVLSENEQNNITYNTGGGDLTNMNHFQKIARDLAKAQTEKVLLNVAVELEDPEANTKVVLSTKDGVSSFYKNSGVNWKPVLSNKQLEEMSNGNGYEVASEILSDFNTYIKTSETIQFIGHSLNDNISEDKKDSTLQEQLDSVRKNNENQSSLIQMLLKEKSDSIIPLAEQLEKDAQEATGESYAEMLNPDMNSSDADGSEIIHKMFGSVAKTAMKYNVSPEEVLNSIFKVASTESAPYLFKVAKLGKPERLKRKKFAQALNPAIPEGNDMYPPMALPEEGTPDTQMGNEAVTDLVDSAPEQTTEGEILAALEVIRDNFQSAIDNLNKILPKQDGAVGDDALSAASAGLSFVGESDGLGADEIVDTVNETPESSLMDSANQQRLPAQASATNKKEASSDKVNKIVSWLLKVADMKQLPDAEIIKAAKTFCSNERVAKGILNKSIVTSGIKVTDESSRSTTIHATLDEIGIDVRDPMFNQKFRDLAINILGESGYEVDPVTFALTDINVTEDGFVCGTVKTTSVKTFSPDKGHPSAVSAGIVMTAEASKLKKANRIQSLIKLAQGMGMNIGGGMGGGMMGGGMGAPGGGVPQMPAQNMGMEDPMIGGMPPTSGDQGVGSLTGSSDPVDAQINATPEPGNKSPWGTICPQCGSKDLDIANGTGNCNSCGAQLTFKFFVEVIPSEESVPKDSAAPMEEMPLDTGMPPTTPDLGGGMGAGMPAAASSGRVMTKVAYRTSARVFWNAMQPGLVKESGLAMVPGSVCLGCGSKEVSKVENKTLCYQCNTMSVTNIKKASKPGEIDVEIVYF